MKKNLIARIMLLPLFALALAACSDDSSDSDYIAPTKTGTGYFSMITDASGSITTVETNSSISMTCNYTAMTATVTLTNVATGPGTTGTYTFSSLPLSISTHTSSLVNVTNVTPDGAPGIVFSSLYIDLIDRDFGQDYIPVIDARYTVGGSNIRLVPTRYYYEGATDVTTTTGAVYRTSGPTYRLTLSPSSRTAQLEIFNAQFATEMRKSDIRMEGLSLSMTSSSFSVSAQSLVPYIGNHEYPDFRVTDLSGTSTYLGAMDIIFAVQGRGTVHANLDYTYTQSPITPDDAGNLVSRSVSGLYTLSTNTDGSYSLIPGASIELIIDNQTNKATARLLDVAKGEGETGSFTLSGLSVSRLNSTYRIAGTDKSPDGMPTIKFNSVNIDFTDRLVNNEATPLLNANYVINGTPVTFVASKYFASGSLAVASSTGSSDTSDSSLATLTIHQSSEADISITRIPIGSSMATLSIYGLTVDFITGGFDLNGAGISTSLPDWTVDDIHVMATYTSRITIEARIANRSTGETLTISGTLNP